MGTNKKLSQLCHTIGTMLDGGVDIQRALRVAGEQCRDGKISRAILRCEKAVAEGSTLWGAIEREKKLPQITGKLVRSGEESGNLSAVFFELSSFFDFKDSLWKRFLSGFLLPVIQYILAVFVISLARYIIASIQDRPAGLLLPLAAGYGIPAGVIFAIWLFSRYCGCRRPFQELLWRTPVICHVIRPIALARFSRTLGFSLGAGIHLKEAIQSSFEASGNEAFAARAETAKEAVGKGNSLNDALKTTGLFDDQYLGVISVGEETGKLVEKLQWLSDEYGRKAQQGLSALTTAATILLWCFVGAVLIYFIFSMASIYFQQISRIVGA